MGAWGTGVLENDTAMDWCDEFLEAPEGGGSEDDAGKLAFLIGAVQLAAEPDEEDDEEDDPMLDADIATEALVAAEIIAAANGRPPAFLTEAEDDPEKSIADWARQNDDEVLRRAEIRALARAAAERVRDASELADLWSESEHAAAWRATIDDLIARLSA